MNLARKLSKNYQLTFLSLLSVAVLMLSTVSCDCRSKNDDPTNSETSNKDTKDKPEHNDKPIDLRLERLGKEVLKSGRKDCELKISNQGTDKTEPNQLQLLITREKGDVATIDGTKELEKGTYSLDIPEAIDKGGAAIYKHLEINLGTDAEAVFKFQLQYKGKIQEGVAEKVICQAGKLELDVHEKHFFGDQIVILELVNYSEDDVDAKDVSVEVVSLNKATFQLVNIEKGDKKLGISSEQVENIFDIQSSIIAKGGGAGVAGFAILNANGETKAEVIVKLKKGQQEIFVSEKVVWEEKGVLLRWKVDDSFRDNEPLKIDLINAGNTTISTDDIAVSLNNKQQIKFKLGNVEGNNIQTPLTKVIGASAIIDPQGKPVSFVLQLAEDLAATQQYAAEINLVFQDKNKGVLLEKKIDWRNQSKFNEKVKYIDFFDKVTIQREAYPTGYQEDTKDSHPGFDWEQAVEQDVKLIPQFGERTIKTFQSRVEAEALTPQMIADKKNLEAFLQQEGKNFPESVKKDFQEVLEAPDDVAVQQIDQLLQEDFERVDQFAQAALEEAQQFAQDGDQPSLDKAIERIDAWVAVVEQFVTEIGTSAAKDLATKVKGYQAEAQNL